jgi:hypothetical protein
VDFFATWCNACRGFFPKWMKTVAEEQSTLFVCVEYDENKDWVTAMGVEVRLPRSRYPAYRPHAAWIESSAGSGGEVSAARRLPLVAATCSLTGVHEILKSIHEPETTLLSNLYGSRESV